MPLNPLMLLVLKYRRNSRSLFWVFDTEAFSRAERYSGGSIFCTGIPTPPSIWTRMHASASQYVLGHVKSVLNCLALGDVSLPQQMGEACGTRGVRVYVLTIIILVTIIWEGSIMNRCSFYLFERARQQVDQEPMCPCGTYVCPCVRTSWTSSSCSNCGRSTLP